MKRPFFLLEVLIALALMMVCAVPLIVGPARGFRQEMAKFEEMERERIADLSFAEIKEQLHRNQIPWSRLPALRETKGPFSLKSEAIQIPNQKEKRIERRFFLYGKGEKRTPNGEVIRMIYAKIEFDPPLGNKKKHYIYRTMAKKSAAP